MENNEAKKLVEKIFKLIKESEEDNNLDGFENFEDVPKAILDFYERTNKNYPAITFTFSKEEVALLKDDFPNFNTESFDNPFTKLFYAMLWKQGDLPKLKHIIDGLEDVKKNDLQGMVMYNFGRFLAEKTNHPIIDQHVIRAFKAGTDIDNIEFYRKMDYLENKSHKEYIAEYKDWIRKFRPKLKGEIREEYLFKVDRILMALGKAIKKIEKK